MTWITVIWSMNAGATLTLAAFCGAVWPKQHENRVYSSSISAPVSAQRYRIMRYRAQCVGSSCEVHAGPTQGTIVHCRVPLEAQHSVSTIL
jgi:hypothetical protein